MTGETLKAAIREEVDLELVLSQMTSPLYRGIGAEDSTADTIRGPLHGGICSR